MPSNTANPESFSKKDQVTGVTTTNDPVAVTFDFEASTTLNYQDIIIASVYITETGTSNGATYSITMQGCEIASGTVAASACAAVKISGYIGDALQVLVESTSDGNAAEVTVEFFGK